MQVFCNNRQQVKQCQERVIEMLAAECEAGFCYVRGALRERSAGTEAGSMAASCREPLDGGLASRSVDMTPCLAIVGGIVWGQSPHAHVQGQCKHEE